MGAVKRTRRAFLALFAASAFAPLHAEDERPVVDDEGRRERKAAANLPTLWIAGDSTVKCNAPMRGWGQEIGRYFDPAKIEVINRAIGGRSSRTFFTEGRWQEIEDALQPGDFVLIQFGHNDVGPPDARSKFRGSVKGIGEETESIEKPDGSTEVVRSYGWYLRAMARGAREKKAKVILCSPIPHKRFDSEGRFIPDWAGWRGWIADCAKQERAAFVDLAELIGRGYAELGPAKVEPLFADKGTHTSPEGALFNAGRVVAGLRGIPTAPLDPFLSREGRRIPKER